MRVGVVKVCVLQGTGGSIRGPGRVAQTQVIKGKEGEAWLEVGGSRVVERFAHACWYDLSLHACLDTYGSVYVRAITIVPNSRVCVREKSTRLLRNVKPVW